MSDCVENPVTSRQGGGISSLVDNLNTPTQTGRIASLARAYLLAILPLTSVLTMKRRKNSYTTCRCGHITAARG
jgi:hypothetical protein